MHQNISSKIVGILKESYGIDDVSIEWSRPDQPEHGDSATPVCLQVAKKDGANPREIA